MDNTTAAIGGALIGAAGVVFAASIRTFGPPLFKIIGRKYLEDSISGTWDATWNIDFPTHKQKTIPDTVHLTANKSGVIEGKGEVVELGQYVIEGKDSHFCILLSFNGIEQKEELAGVALLKKLPGGERFEGQWIQLDRDGEMIGGRVKLYNKHN